MPRIARKLPSIHNDDHIKRDSSINIDFPFDYRNKSNKKSNFG